jgi:hypothetical protein
MSHKMNPMWAALPTASTLHTSAGRNRSSPSRDSSPNSRSLAHFVHLPRGRKPRERIVITRYGRPCSFVFRVSRHRQHDDEASAEMPTMIVRRGERHPQPGMNASRERRTTTDVVAQRGLSRVQRGTSRVQSRNVARPAMAYVEIWAWTTSVAGSRTGSGSRRLTAGVAGHGPWQS